MNRNDISAYKGIKTYIHNDFSLEAMDPETISIMDIAHALSMVPRWGGHIPRFYSVAEHSMRVAELVPDQHQLAALLHDASEAYLGDLCKPFKNLMPDYQRIEDKLMQVIATKYGFEYPLHKDVKVADHIILLKEWDWFKTDNGEEYPMWHPLTPEQAKKGFLTMYRRIVHKSEHCNKL